MPKPSENWTCPYCGQGQVISKERYDKGHSLVGVDGAADGDLAYEIEAIVCANDKCRKLSLEFTLANGQYVGNHLQLTKRLKTWRLMPASSAKPQPDCVPKPLQDDYYEACAIRDLSPKASATLARRCIQGMIRDFCGINRNRLIEEINELKRLVDEEHAPIGVQVDTVEAIDHVRKIGNIGAHMEADINVIVDVDPGEAQKLIDLIEFVFAEWYVARDRRKKRLAEIKAIAESKDAARKPMAVKAKPAEPA